jgi:3-carboxy-cis,cis-muconate cycloisomerase
MRIAIVTERLAVVLAPVLGKAHAKKLLSTASAEAATTDRPLTEILLAHPELATRFTHAHLSDLLAPTRYTGAADALVDRALRAYEEFIKFPR